MTKSKGVGRGYGSGRPANPFTLEFLYSRTVSVGDCLVWTGTINKTRGGYGLVRFNGTFWLTHRAAYTLAHGEIPDGMLVCHRCDIPACIAADHLFLGTQSDNMRDKVVKNRQARGARSGRAKLTEQDVRAIRADPRSDYMMAKSGDYPVNETNIRSARLGRTWGWVT